MDGSRNAMERKERVLPPFPFLSTSAIGGHVYTVAICRWLSPSLPFPYYLSVPPLLRPREKGGGSRHGPWIIRNCRKLAPIFVSRRIRSTTRKVKLAAPSSLVRRGGTRVVPASCPRRQEHGAHGWQVNTPGCARGSKFSADGNCWKWKNRMGKNRNGWSDF